ncbi:MAG: hypothetical protein KDA88_09185 [Planctomycetaceae bacterium]|nr:hypothetical protein [Planctomycetaceae bacterium]
MRKAAVPARCCGLLSVVMIAVCMTASYAADIESIPADLVVPEVTDGPPAPGKRVRVVNEEFAGTQIHHLLYLPTDWEPGKSYPVIVEYAGNKYRTSLGTVEGSSLGYGITGGEGAIWVCMPFVDQAKGVNATNWWGNVDATVAYCISTVHGICEQYGGDSSKVFIAGFSRGAIACNYIGLHNDEIASLWCGFICHSHYDGVRQWNYAGSDRTSAAQRLARLGDRPQFISHESSVDATRDYLKGAAPQGKFTFVSLPFADHTDTWVLREIPERTTLREWFWNVAGREHSKTE